MASPLDNLTDAIGLPKGFLDALYPFSLYQTNPPNLDTLDRASGMGGMSTAPHPLGSPNPFGQMIPPPPGMGQLMGSVMGGMGGPGLGAGGGPPGLGMPPPPVPPGLGMPSQGGLGQGPLTPPSASPAPQLGAGNPLWPWINRNQNPAMPVSMMLRLLLANKFNPPGAGLNAAPPGTPPLPLARPGHKPRGARGSY